MAFPWQIDEQDNVQANGKGGEEEPQRRLK